MAAGVCLERDQAAAEMEEAEVVLVLLGPSGDVAQDLCFRIRATLADLRRSLSVGTHEQPGA